MLRAPNGRRALAMLRERRPDVLLLDLVMPGMDGYALLQQKEVDPEIRAIPVLAISAQDPSLGPMASSVLTVEHSGGLLAHDVLRIVRAVSEILAPPDRLDRAR